MKLIRMPILVAAALAVAAPAAIAAPGKAHSEQSERRDESPQLKRAHADKGHYRLGKRERRVVRDYYSQAENCPPGLAKKNNGCMPPGLAKKRYAVGRRLSSDVAISEPPIGLLNRLPALPEGRGYRFIDNDLGVVELSTLVLLKALRLH